ncbi:MAG TPA: Ig-like domain-containing protein, partial [Myxococcales bacterium]|nr:Ig-like domain-containing protein [Myxococcales bacterium]
MAAALLAFSAAASPPAVTAIYPVYSIRAGARSVEMGFELSGQGEQVAVTATGTSATAGQFAQLPRVVVSRDQAGLIPFHVLVPLGGPFPADGVLQVSATPISADDTASTATVAFDARAAGAGFDTRGIEVRASPSTGEILVDVHYRGALASAELTLLGVSSQMLRSLNGELEEAEAHAFAATRRRLGRPLLSTPGHVAFAIPVTVPQIPPDGVVVVDVALTDPFGRTVHDSTVEFADSAAFDSVLSLLASPSPLVLTQGFGQTERLQVFARYAIAGDVDVSGGVLGASYRSLDESVAIVTADGLVFARENGETEIEISYAGYTTRVPLLVDSTATLERVQITPVSPVIPRVGASVQLKLEGVLSSGRLADLTPGAVGTSWTSSDPLAVAVSPDGKVRSLRPGSAMVAGTHQGYSAQVRVDALDGPPSIRVIAPPTVTAGTTFDLKAEATDDIRVAQVELLLDGVPATVDTTAPYSFLVSAPPFAGGVIRLSARVTDSGGNTVTAQEVLVRVAGAMAPSSKQTVWELPLPGQILLEGLPHVLRVTSGDWPSGKLLPSDFQLVRFTVDDAPLGVVEVPRVEVRTLQTSDGSRQIPVPLWELSYVPPRGSAGTTAVIRAEAIDARGAKVPVEALLVRIAADSPPLVTLQRPATPLADATVGVPFTVSGTVGDDALSLGVDVSLLIDGAAVAYTRLNAAGVDGTMVGSQGFSFSWTPPASSVGKSVKVEVSAVDVSGNERRSRVDVRVLEDRPPQISILTPIAESTVTVGTAMELTASTLDDSRQPVKVSWSVSGAPVAISSTPPYRAVFAADPALSGRTLLVEAVAEDSSGQTTRTTVNVFATPDVSPPSLAIATPRDTQDVPNTRDLLVSVAGIDDVDVTKVEILFDGLVVFTDESPGKNAGIERSFVSYAVIPAAQLRTASEHRIRARAYDPAGNVGTAPEVLIHAREDQPPEVSIASPGEGEEVTIGTTLEVLVSADDDVAVSEVELFAGSQSAGVRVFPPYRFELQITGAPRTLALKAVAKDSGGFVTEVTRQVLVKADDRPPMVAFRRPTESARVFAGRTTAVEVVASDNVSVSWAELYLGGAKIARVTGGVQDGLYRVFTFQLPVPAAVGPVEIRALVSDPSNLTTSRTETLQVVEDLPPQVTLLAPPPGSPYREGEDVQLEISAADDDGVIGIAGVSGGIRQGDLPDAGLPIDVTRPKILVVRAPIVSRAQPATVGAVARDTAGQLGSAELLLQVALDTEAPSAVLASPVPPRQGPLELAEGAAVGARVEVRDNVRVARVAAMVDSTEVKRPGTGDDPLHVLEERFEEVRVPDPLGPGSILVSREYVGAFGGTIPLAGLAPGDYQLFTRAFDPAGNFTDTSSVPIRIRPFVDQESPRITLRLDGAPDEQTIVGGSTIQVAISVSDDGPLAEVSALYDGTELELPALPVPPPHFFQARVPITLPAITSEEARTVTFTIHARDGSGKVSESTAARDLVPDAPPSVAVSRPAAGAIWTEDRLEPITIDARDDVGIASAAIILSTTAPALVSGATADRLELPAPASTADSTAPSLRWRFGEDQTFELQAEQGRVSVAPHASTSLGNAPGRALLRVPPSPTGKGVRADVTYRYRIAAGAEGHPAVVDFLRRNPGGLRTVSLTAVSDEVDLSFPASLVLVDEIGVALSALEAGSEPLAVTRTSLAYDAFQVQVRAAAAGEMVAFARVPAGDARPGRQVSLQHSIRLPLGFAPRPGFASALGRDTHGARALASIPLVSQPDTRPPAAAITAPPTGARVVEDAPVRVDLTLSDDVEVAEAEILVDGISAERLVRPLAAATRTMTFRRPADGRPVAVSVVARDRAGNASASQPVFLDVRPDAPPQARFAALTSAVETLSRTELESGYVRLLQGTPATVQVEVSDDVAVRRVQVEYLGASIFDQVYTTPLSAFSVSATFTPP